MSCRDLLQSSALMLAAALLTPGTSAAQATPAKPASRPAVTTPARAALPRTAWGDPDLQGIWRGAGAPPLERALALGDQEYIELTDAEIADRLQKAEARKALQAAGKIENRGFRILPNYNGIWDYSDAKPQIPRRTRTSAIVDPSNGRLPPWSLEQVKYWDAREAATQGHGETDTVNDMNLNLRCIVAANTGAVTNWGLGFGGHESSGIGRSEFPAEDVSENDGLGLGASAGPVRRIVQSKGYVAFALGDGTAYRIVPLDARPVPGPKIRQWLGIARGRWDGNTLVVETTNITLGSPVIPNYGGSMYPGSGETLRIIERFTRTAADTIDYRYTIDDPGVYTRPYTVQLDLKITDEEPLTSICQEDTKTKANILANARADEWTSVQIGQDSIDARKERLEQLRTDAVAAAAGTSGTDQAKRPATAPKK
jgi:hypothetical protein